jgi:hypothetical protein
MSEGNRSADVVGGLDQALESVAYWANQIAALNDALDSAPDDEKPGIRLAQLSGARELFLWSRILETQLAAEARRRWGLSWRTLAEEIGISRQALQKRLGLGI